MLLASKDIEHMSKSFVKTLTPKGAACRNLTFSMTTTSASHISFIQSLFLTKIVGLVSNSNLVFVVKFKLNPRHYADLACILVQEGLVLNCICSIIYEAFFSVARSFLNTRNSFS